MILGRDANHRKARKRGTQKSPNGRATATATAAAVANGTGADFDDDYKKNPTKFIPFTGFKIGIFLFLIIIFKKIK